MSDINHRWHFRKGSYQSPGAAEHHHERSTALKTVPQSGHPWRTGGTCYLEEASLQPWIYKTKHCFILYEELKSKIYLIVPLFYCRQWVKKCHQGLEFKMKDKTDLWSQTATKRGTVSRDKRVEGFTQKGNLSREGNFLINRVQSKWKLLLSKPKQMLTLQSCRTVKSPECVQSGSL